MNRIVLALAGVCCIVLAGCRTTAIGEPIAIPIPHNLSEQQAQQLVTRFVDRANRSGTRSADDDALRRLFATVQRHGSVARRYRGRWRVESWKPGSIVAAYAWKRHVLRVHLQFQDRTVFLGIGKGTNVRQSSTQIHTTAKALANELTQDIRFVFGKVASGDAALVAAIESRGAARSSFCDVMWESDDRQRAECRRAQRSAYDRLRSQIDRVEVDPTSAESRTLKECYAHAQTRAGTDWEATARCFYAYPASSMR